jgi:hypothetical protein
MIHVLTVHWKDDNWIDIQLKFLAQYINSPFKVYAFLNDLPNENQHRGKYFYSSTEYIESHPIKLNLLADLATLHSTDEEDWLIFIDGDAFPIGDVVSFGSQKLKEYPLVAIQRRENLEDIQPHPCFSITTVKFWQDIGGDWKAGYQWETPYNKTVTDVGGNLLKILNDAQIEWHPMLRSNQINRHPLWFGIYEDLIYHHGAGFRAPISRVDIRNDLRKRLYFKILRSLPRSVGDKLGRERFIQKNMLLSQEIYESILRDPFFYRAFQ